MKFGSYKWTVTAEPLEEGHVGLIVTTERGKAIASGEATIQADGSLHFTCQTLYPGITNAVKLEGKIEGKIDTDGKASVTAYVGSSC